MTVDQQLRTLLRCYVFGIAEASLREILSGSQHGPWSDTQISLALARAQYDGFAEQRDGLWRQTDAAVAIDDLQIRQALGDDVRPWLIRCFGERLWKLWILAALLLLVVGSCVCWAHR